MLAARLKQYQAQTRWEVVRALPFVTGLLWRKFGP